MPYEIQKTTILLSNNPFSPISYDGCREARVIDQIYRNLIKYNSNDIVRCLIERLYAICKNPDLHTLDLQQYNVFVPPKILYKKNVHKHLLWQKEESNSL